MKMLWVTAIIGLSLLGALDPASAQRSSRDDGYDERAYDDRGYDEDRGRERGRGYDDDDRGRDRGRGYDGDDRRRDHGRGYDDDDRGRDRDRRYDGGRDRERRYDDDGDRRQERGRGQREEPEARFDEDEYLRCHPDVRRAVERGDMTSGAFHYRTFGRREGRRLTCPMKI